MMEEDALEGLDNLVVLETNHHICGRIYSVSCCLCFLLKKNILFHRNFGVPFKVSRPILQKDTEGYYYQEGIRFFYISRGSLEEVYSHISMAIALGMSPVDSDERISMLKIKGICENCSMDILLI